MEEAKKTGGARLDISPSPELGKFTGPSPAGTDRSLTTPSPAAPSPISTLSKDSFEGGAAPLKPEITLADPEGILAGSLSDITKRLSHLSGTEIKKQLSKTGLARYFHPKETEKFLWGTQLDHIENMRSVTGLSTGNKAILAFVETLKSFDTMNLDELSAKDYAAHQYQEMAIRQSLAFAILNARVALEKRLEPKMAFDVANQFTKILAGQKVLLLWPLPIQGGGFRNTTVLKLEAKSTEKRRRYITCPAMYSPTLLFGLNF